MNNFSLRLGQNLTVLSLNNSPSVTDYTLGYLSKYCVNLKKLYIARFQDFGEGSTFFLKRLKIYQSKICYFCRKIRHH